MSPELQQVIIDCQKELSKARNEAMKIKHDVRTVEHHLYEAMKILQNALPPTD